MEAIEPMHHLKTKVLKRSTAVEHAVHILLGDADAHELEVLQFRELKSCHGVNLGGNALHEPSAAQHGREAKRGRWQRAQMSSLKAELLELN